MRTDAFDYELPAERIAQVPARGREQSRMLVVDRATGDLTHAGFADLPRYLRPGDLLVLNDTRVLPSRLYVSKIPSGGRVELLLLEEHPDGTWEALMRASRRPRSGSRLQLGSGAAVLEVVAEGEQGRCRIRIESDRPVLDLLEAEGRPPLPPYIRRDADEAARAEDRERYQTVFAAVPGAVAAPTAGLHFTHAMFGRLLHQGVDRCTVTLHVGIGTFRPVSADRVEDHVMSSERFELPAAAAEAVARTRGNQGRVVAVGSTSVRTLETQAAESGRVTAGTGRTSLFIHPPYRFQVVDAMLTNFHLPRSTLLMMVCAFGGRDLILHAYREAVREQYRFYSYGDCMLIV